MAEAKPEPPPRPSTSSFNGPPSSAMRYRLPQRQSSTQGRSPNPPPLPRRRSSILSYSSIEDATQSFTDEIINPRTGNRKAKDDDEVTHWHSTPLAFAILPAIAGLLFQNGSAFVTDGLLLTLAAVFMNWSIRVPWDWYYSAQALRRDVEPYDSSIIEENDETAVTSSSGSSPKHGPADSTPEPSSSTQNVRKREEAAADLRMQELLALVATFVFPALAAYLLHVIRSQLTRPSTVLVSDYNLSIFLLAAEIRPFRQIVRLVSNRTLHLQRTATGLEDPFAETVEEKTPVTNLASRISDLEARLSEHALVPTTVNIAQKGDVSELAAEMKKRYEPRLEGLERAVRRYEKRSTTMGMVVEARLVQLESRLQDALSLAAVAAQHSQKRGVLAYMLETVSAIIAWLLKLAWSICVWPLLVVEELYAKAKGLMLGPAPSRPNKRKQHAGVDEKARAKGTGRKAVR